MAEAEEDEDDDDDDDDDDDKKEEEPAEPAEFDIGGGFAAFLRPFAATAAANFVRPVAGSSWKASSHDCPPTPEWHRSSKTNVAWLRVSSARFR